MNVFELVEITGEQIVISPQEDGYSVDFENLAEVTNGTILSSVYAHGRTLKEAMFKFVNNFKGKTLVFDAMSDTRREFEIPDSLGE